MTSVLDWHRAFTAHPDIDVVGVHVWVPTARPAIGQLTGAAVWVRRGVVEVVGATICRWRGDVLRAVAVTNGIPVRGYEVGAASEPSIVSTIARLARQRYTPAPVRERRRVAWEARWGRDIDHLPLATAARDYCLIRGAITGAGWPTGQDIANVLDPAPSP